MPKSRREFFKKSIALGSAFAIPPTLMAEDGVAEAKKITIDDLQVAKYTSRKELNLSPANWIWFPSERCLPNTFVFFRKEVDLTQKPVSAKGWILGESRYKFYANGNRIQFGPAPFDPRWAEADPIDITAQLKVGKNILGAEVLYYGTGDGTWPIGKPGFIFYLEINFANQEKTIVVSDSTWKTSIAESWRPGQYKRWYLRALQEEFDARLYPTEWNTEKSDTEVRWRNAMIIDGAANKPVITTHYRDYLYDSQGQTSEAELRARSITLSREVKVPVQKLSESMWLEWSHSPEEYFNFVTPNPYAVDRKPAAKATANNSWEVELTKENVSAILTFELTEQIVGFPYFTINAPAGTTIEILFHEGHVLGTDALLNTHFHSWCRFICKEGVNTFETFDYECLRWLQLHIRQGQGIIKIEQVGVRRKMFDWQHKPNVKCSDPKIQKVINASINTLYNCAIETIVDGMGRERQQYSGDVGHVLHSIFLTMGEPTMAARFINTYSQGITSQGYFLDCWPAYDRLARIMEREMGLTQWGPLIDHGIGFNFDCYHYYLYTGEVESIKEVFPRLIRFFRYLQSIKLKDGLLPVENIGVPVVWIDHYAYKKIRHKQCAFNQYASAMMIHALAPLCRAFGEDDLALAVEIEGNNILKATVDYFWSDSFGTFVNNQPWLDEEKEIRLCDRSLATALLFDQCPELDTKASIKMLKETPEYMGVSYPANANWRYWALSKFGDQSFIKEVREKWSAMPSVILNNTLSEDWNPKPDSNAIWSHCPISPLFGMHMCVAGIRPVKPGFREIEITPVLGDLEQVELTTYTVLGPIYLVFTQAKGKLTAAIDLPDGVSGTIKWKNNLTSLKAGKQVLKLG